MNFSSFSGRAEEKKSRLTSDFHLLSGRQTFPQLYPRFLIKITPIKNPTVSPKMTTDATAPAVVFPCPVESGVP